MSNEKKGMSNVNELLQKSQIKKTKQKDLKKNVDDSESDSDTDSDSSGDDADAKQQEDSEVQEYTIITPGGTQSEDTGVQHTLKGRVKGKGKQQAGANHFSTASATAGATQKETVCKICGFDAQGSRNKCKWQDKAAEFLMYVSHSSKL